MAGAPIPNVDCGGVAGGCDPVAVTGLCLADGTPIAVVTSRDCVTGVVSQDGWVDLTSGVFTAGLPPAGTVACGADNYEFALSGWLCDVLPDGSVAGTALVQIERDASGAVIGVVLIGVDGLPYTPVGVMRRCPDDQVVALVLCDQGNSGFRFVRFFVFTQSGVVPSRDTDLDGNPYTPVGPVEVCAPVTPVVPVASQKVKTYRANIVGVGGWRLGADTYGGKVKSVSVRRRPGGPPGSVTIEDNTATPSVLLPGESETWSVGPLDDELVGGITVRLTDPANDVVIVWTEAP